MQSWEDRQQNDQKFKQLQKWDAYEKARQQKQQQQDEQELQQQDEQEDKQLGVQERPPHEEEIINTAPSPAVSFDDNATPSPQLATIGKVANFPKGYSQFFLPIVTH